MNSPVPGQVTENSLAEKQWVGLFSRWLADGTISAGQLATALRSPFPVELNRFLFGMTSITPIFKRVRPAVGTLCLGPKDDPPLSLAALHNAAKRRRGSHGAYPASLALQKHLREYNRLWSSDDYVLEALDDFSAFEALLEPLLASIGRAAPSVYQRVVIASEIFGTSGFEHVMLRQAELRDFAFCKRLAAHLDDSIFLHMGESNRRANKLFPALNHDYRHLVETAVDQTRWIRERDFTDDIRWSCDSSLIYSWLRLLGDDGVIEREKRKGVWYMVASRSSERHELPLEIKPGQYQHLIRIRLAEA